MEKWIQRISELRNMNHAMPLAEIHRHPGIAGDLKKLRKFPKPDASLESWEMLFRAKGFRGMPGIDAYPGFGERKVYKARVVPLGENMGKSSGYRLIFEHHENAPYRILVFSRHAQYKHERELRQLIHARLIYTQLP